MPILDLNQAGDVAALEAAVCVIGSGPGGGVVAVELAAAGIDVLLLEAGPVSFDSGRRDAISAINVDDHVDLSLGYSSQLGGSSNRWGGRTAPFDAIDLDDRPWVHDSGWPIAWRDLEPYLKKASELIGIPDYSAFCATNSARLPLLADGVEARCYQWARRPVNLRENLLQAASRVGSTLRIVVNAPVTQFKTNSDRTRVDSAIVAGPAGHSIPVKARTFVLAAGAIETSRLLLNSHDDHAVGLGNDYDHVGRYLMTHPRAFIGSLRLNKPMLTEHPLLRTDVIGTGHRRYCLGLSASVQSACHTLNHHIQLLPFLEYRLNRLFDDVKRSKLTQSKMFDRGSRTRTLLPKLGRFSYKTMERAASIKMPARQFVLRGFLDQHPDPENRISLTNDRDVEGMRKVAIDWRFSQRDRESVLAFLDKLDSSVRAGGLGKVDSGALRASDDWSMTGIHSHFMGTTRMGEHPRTAVTDRNGRLFHTGNLYISGPSVFTTSGSANPFLTIVALSMRLADHLRRQLDVPYRGLTEIFDDAADSSARRCQTDLEVKGGSRTQTADGIGRQSNAVPRMDR